MCCVRAREREPTRQNSDEKLVGHQYCRQSTSSKKGQGRDNNYHNTTRLALIKGTKAAQRRCLGDAGGFVRPRVLCCSSRTPFALVSPPAFYVCVCVVCCLPGAAARRSAPLPAKRARASHWRLFRLNIIVRSVMVSDEHLILLFLGVFVTLFYPQVGRRHRIVTSGLPMPAIVAGAPRLARGLLESSDQKKQTKQPTNQ